MRCVDLDESFQSSFQIDPNSNEYLLAKFGFDTAEKEPCKVCPLSAYRSPRYTDNDVAAKSLRYAREAFASARRYVEGTWKEYQFGEDVPGWIRWALYQRRQKGL